MSPEPRRVSRQAPPALEIEHLHVSYGGMRALSDVSLTVPEGAVTFTVKRTVHVVFGAMLLFSWQTICPVP